MRKTALYGTLALVLFAGCNNFFHELVPPDGNRIESFSVPGQLGSAQIGDTTVHVTVGPGTDIAALVPSITVSAKATLIPVTIPYIQKAFPSANVFREAFSFYASQDKADYVIDLIKRNPDFGVPALDEAIDFSEPVTFLVVSGLGNIRQYTVNVEIDSGVGKFLSFGFSKFDNPDLTRGNAVGAVNTTTIDVEVWYPVENIASYQLIPTFQTNGAVVSLDGNTLTSGTGMIDFTPKPTSSADLPLTRTKTLVVQRPGFAAVNYTLSVTFKEDPNTDHSITDFRFDKDFNYGIRYTAVGEIVDDTDTGTITLRVYYSGNIPATLVPSFVSPGTVSVEGSPQYSGATFHDFNQILYYKVVSPDTIYTRTYRVSVDFINESDPRPRMNGFTFTMMDNPTLTSDSSAMIDHAAGLVVIEAVYTTDPPPYTLVPQFSAGGVVSVGGLTQASGINSQDFSHRVKYTVTDPGNPSFYRDYWVEVRFVKESFALAEISLFRFEQADNPDLCADVTATINQVAGTIDAVLLFETEGTGHRNLVPRWLTQGTVHVGGTAQTSGLSGQIFNPAVVYRAVSADGTFYRDYTVTIREINTRIYVNKNATGDNTGVSWANAFRSLPDACAAAEQLPAALPVELWIAEGSYRPSETRNRTTYFTVRGGAGYYGGFAGNETAKTQRVPGTHPVTITGDLGGGTYSEHLFMNADFGGKNAIFDGINFTKARALTGADPVRSGAAINLRRLNNLTITNCFFEDLRTGFRGGAVYTDLNNGGSVNIRGSNFKATGAERSGGGVTVITDLDSSITVVLEDCDFEDTPSGTHGGGAMAISNHREDDIDYNTKFSGSITIRDCNFDNVRSTTGGAIVVERNFAGSFTMEDCNFNNVQAGGAAFVRSDTAFITINRCNFENFPDAGSYSTVYAYNASGGSIAITNCVFENIQGGGLFGGAVYASGSGGSVTITDCDFENIRNDGLGGGAISTSGTSVIITDCDFENTRAENGSGGAVYASGTLVTITDCDFEDTRAENGSGGAIYASVSGGSVIIRDLTITDAHAVNSSSGDYFAGGGGIYISSYSFPTAEISRVAFTNVTAEGSADFTSGGAVAFNRVALTMTDCSIDTTGSDKFGGAIGGAGVSSCVLNGVSFVNCNALTNQGSVLFGNKYTTEALGMAPAYTVRPGCSLDGTPITSSNLDTVLASPSRRYLPGGSTIVWAP
jgi:hypothetical protein